MFRKNVPETTIKRLPVYLGVLEHFEKQGREFVNSQDFEDLVDIKQAILRKDLSFFGELGIRGKGYEVKSLTFQIKKLIGIDSRTWKTVIIGAGNIAQALMKYKSFEDINLDITAAFDSDPAKIGKRFGNVPVLDIGSLEQVINEEGIKFVILTSPGEVVGEILEVLKQTKIKGLINFTPEYLRVSKKVKVINVNITAKILTMFFYLKNQ
ncbi:MAG: redox-sensing transcriptional repressor Rex [Candidatus Margulisiibacteriota bacterium]